MLVASARPRDPEIRGMENARNPIDIRVATPPRCPFKIDRIISISYVVTGSADWFIKPGQPPSWQYLQLLNQVFLKGTLESCGICVRTYRLPGKLISAHPPSLVRVRTFGTTANNMRSSMAASDVAANKKVANGIEGGELGITVETTGASYKKKARVTASWDFFEPAYAVGNATAWNLAMPV